MLSLRGVLARWGSKSTRGTLGESPCKCRHPRFVAAASSVLGAADLPSEIPAAGPQAAQQRRAIPSSTVSSIAPRKVLRGASASAGQTMMFTVPVSSSSVEVVLVPLHHATVLFGSGVVGAPWAILARSRVNQREQYCPVPWRGARHLQVRRRSDACSGPTHQSHGPHMVASAGGPRLIHPIRRSFSYSLSRTHLASLRASAALS